jgi:hypothetical protein
VKRDYGAKGDGIHDETIACRSAVGAISSTGGTIGYPLGQYRATDDVTINTTGSHFLGVGERAAMFYFNPTAAKTMWSFTAGAAILSLCSVRHLTLSGQGGFQKTGIQILDGSEIIIDDVEIINWTGDTSIGIQVAGRELVLLNKVRIYADRPISIEQNPNLAGNAADHFHFSDLFLVPQVATESCIVIAPDVQVNNLTIDGAQAWCLGKHGLFWDDAEAPGSTNINLHVSNVRREQTEDPTAYTIYINHPTKNLLFDNVGCDATARGFFFRQANSVTIQNCYYNGTGEAFNADSSCSNIVFINFLRNPASSMTMTGLTKTFDQPPIEIWQPS